LVLVDINFISTKSNFDSIKAVMTAFCHKVRDLKIINGIRGSTTLNAKGILGSNLHQLNGEIIFETIV
jgi:hypothetical protein